MNIELKEITVRELTEGFKDNAENGVIAYGGKLDVRPPYQREFIYKDKQRDAVIDTVTKSFPLNVMYWAVKEDGTYEVIDGQQRTISICQFVNEDFNFLMRYFDGFEKDEKEQILNYKLMVYLCSGTDSEKLKWFETINIAGVKLRDQELKNAVYTGTWVSDAKRYFSKVGCVAYQIGNYYLNGEYNRQDFLETAIDWISNSNVKIYMANHQKDHNASALWRYFQDVISWVEATFTVRRKFMKGVDWGALYNKYKDGIYDAKQIEKQTAMLIADDDVENKKGIYSYLLTGDERPLGIRAFSDSVKQKVFEKQKGVCPICKNHFDISEMEGDHITPWKENGKTIEANCQMLCRNDNRRKGTK